MSLYQSFSVAVLVLLAAAARARVVTADLLVHLHRSPGVLRAVGAQLIAACAHLAHIGLLWSLRLLRTVRKRDEHFQKERKDIPVQILKHGCEEVIAFEFIYDYRVFLLIGSSLYALFEIIHVAKMRLPMLVYLEQDNILGKGLGNLPSVGVVRFLQIDGERHLLDAVRDRDGDVLIHLALLLVHFLDDRIELGDKSLHPTAIFGFHLLAELVLNGFSLALL